MVDRIKTRLTELPNALFEAEKNVGEKLSKYYRFHHTHGPERTWTASQKSEYDSIIKEYQKAIAIKDNLEDEEKKLRKTLTETQNTLMRSAVSGVLPLDHNHKKSSDKNYSSMSHRDLLYIFNDALLKKITKQLVNDEEILELKKKHTFEREYSTGTQMRKEDRLDLIVSKPREDINNAVYQVLTNKDKKIRISTQELNDIFKILKQRKLTNIALNKSNKDKIKELKKLYYMLVIKDPRKTLKFQLKGLPLQTVKEFAYDAGKNTRRAIKVKKSKKYKKRK